MLRFDVFGREVGVLREDGRWTAVFIGRDGKNRAAPAIVIPPDLPSSELARFLGDLFHESAGPDRPDVIPLTPDGAADAADS